MAEVGEEYVSRVGLPESSSTGTTGEQYHNKGNPVFSCPISVPPEAQVSPCSVMPELYICQKEKPKSTGPPVHPMYRTSNSDYGGRAPSVHTMPITFHAKSQEFSNHLGKCGMYRNSSLNTGLDSSNTPDH